jgi:hypothetical protein
MDIKNFANNLKNEIQKLVDDGITEIKSENLVAYLDQVTESPEDGSSIIALEKYRADLQVWVEHHKRNHASDLELFKSVILAGQNALRTAFLMNGGATVAMLAFLGKLSDVNQVKIPIFSESLIMFVIGVLAITMSSGMTYISQWFYNTSEGWKQKAGLVLNIFAIVLGLSSYGFFIWGAARAYKAFIGFA